MSDYINKSALIEALENECKGQLIGNENVTLISFGDVIDLVFEQPTIDETEIIRKAFERVVQRLEEARQKYQRLVKEQGEKEDEVMNIHFRGMMNIVKEEGGIE